MYLFFFGAATANSQHKQRDRGPHELKWGIWNQGQIGFKLEKERRGRKVSVNCLLCFMRFYVL